MNNFILHLSHAHGLLVVFAIALICALVSAGYYIYQGAQYGSPFEFAPRTMNVLAGVAGAIVIGVGLYGFLVPYTPPPSKQIAIVLGDTQNTPKPAISSDIAKQIEGTLLQHKGDDAFSLVDSVKIISATKNPSVVSLDASNLHLKEIGNNSANAKRDAEADEQVIEKKIASLNPNENGADYLAGILAAHDNVDAGANIIVIGSGLSDNGDINFSKTNILVNEQNRNQVIENVVKKYGADYLDKYNVTFYGLGDTDKPQEPLSQQQKVVVRDLYHNAVRSLGGTVAIVTRTMTGDPTFTNYVVGTTDTGCGDIGLIFDDDSLKFVSNEAQFMNESDAKKSLQSVYNVWTKNKDTIQTIQVDGYIAHYSGADELSQQRADLVKQELVSMGVPKDKITATGKGYGPYNNDSQNRMVKVTISRGGGQCES